MFTLQIFEYMFLIIALGTKVKNQRMTAINAVYGPVDIHVVQATQT